MIRALLLSGGTGTRLGGDIPKQYLEVNNKPIIEYSIRMLLGDSHIDTLTVVASVEWQKLIEELLNKCDGVHKFIGFALPGENRQGSVYNGLLKMKNVAVEGDGVLIHDAARPLLKSDFIERMVVSLSGHDGVLPVLPMKDTVYMADNGGRITSLLDRKHIVAGQAPELFDFMKYLKANEKLFKDGKLGSINGSTEPAFLAGMDVVTITGDELNFKITTSDDLKRFKRIMAGIEA